MSFMWWQQGLFRPQSSGFWYCMIIFYTNMLSLLEVCRVRSKTYTSRSSSLLGCNTCQCISNSWHGPPKCQEWLAKWHSITFQKTWILSNATVRTSNLMLIPRYAESKPDQIYDPYKWKLHNPVNHQYVYARLHSVWTQKITV